MSEEFEFNFEQRRRKRRRAGGTNRHWRDRASPIADQPAAGLLGDRPAQDAPEPAFSLPVDPWRLVEAFRGRWHWIFLATAILAWSGFMAAFWKAPYSVSFQLIRRTVPASPGGNNDSYSGRDISLDALATFMKSPGLLETACSNALAQHIDPQLTPRELEKSVEVQPTRNPDIFRVILKRTGSERQSVELANLYAANLLDFTRDQQERDLDEISQFYKEKSLAAERNLREATGGLTQFLQNARLIDVAKETEAFLTALHSLETRIADVTVQENVLEFKIGLARQNPGSDQLAAARQQLNDLLLRYTTNHPAVLEQLYRIEQLKKEARAALTNSAPLPDAPGSSFGSQWAAWQAQRMELTNTLALLEHEKAKMQQRSASLSEQGVQYAVFKQRIDSLEAQKTLWDQKEREAEDMRKHPEGYYDIFSPAKLSSVDPRGRWLRIILLTVAGGLLGFIGCTAVVLLSEAGDDRLKTVGDVRRVTQLPLLASLGELRTMDATEQVNWAFRTLTILKGKLNSVNGHSLVCGFISARHGEGRSTWVNLLVSAASQRGYRVLTIDTRPVQPEPSPPPPEGDKRPSLPVPVKRWLLSPQVLSRPTEVEARLNDSGNLPVVHIPLPGWVWNLERRHEWQAALNQWRQIENLVLLIELPPASQPESVLLAENLPQVIWLTGSGLPTSRETAEHLETLRQARCRLVGAVLNREPDCRWRRRFCRWTGLAFLLAGLLGGLPNSAQPAPANGTAAATMPPTTNVFFSASNSSRRFPWQQRLTLGPGDVLDCELFGHPELARTNLFVGPDGRLSYLQAQDIPVTGLTIDELREDLNRRLSKFYGAAQTIVAPVAFNSKKYFLLGKVNVPGAYRLDRPITIIEAVARARGLETGLLERRTVELADLSRSFLARNGRPVEVNFEKLFLDGDLSQNVSLEPGDYLYFASANDNQVYVLGQVNSPGLAVYVPNSSLLAALTARGGLTRRAYKQKVLIVRGSLRDPETYVVNVEAILHATQPDFKLRPRDIVYVSSRPWIKIEDLLNEAGQAFVEAAVATWAGANIGPIITHPALPQL